MSCSDEWSDFQAERQQEQTPCGRSLGCILKDAPWLECWETGLWVDELRDHSSKLLSLHAGALEDQQPVFGVVSTENQAGLVQSLKFLLRYLFSFVSPFF